MNTSHRQPQKLVVLTRTCARASGSAHPSLIVCDTGRRFSLDHSTHLADRFYGNGDERMLYGRYVARWTKLQTSVEAWWDHRLEARTAPGL
jgi:hypothetical protein